MPGPGFTGKVEATDWHNRGPVTPVDISTTLTTTPGVVSPPPSATSRYLHVGRGPGEQFTYGTPAHALTIMLALQWRTDAGARIARHQYPDGKEDTPTQH